MCIQKTCYMYVSPIYIYSIYPPFHCHCQCLVRSLSFFSSCRVVIPNVEQEGRISYAETADKPKFVSYFSNRIKILCTFVQIPNQYNIFTYHTWLSNGGSWCLTSSDPYWVLFKHHLLTIKMHKIYIYANVNKSMGARKTYLHVQIKLYYMEG